MLPSAETERLDCGTSALTGPICHAALLPRQARARAAAAAAAVAQGAQAQRPPVAEQPGGGLRAIWAGLYVRIRTRQRFTRFGWDSAARGSWGQCERQSIHRTIYYCHPKPLHPPSAKSEKREKPIMGAGGACTPCCASGGCSSLCPWCGQAPIGCLQAPPHSCPRWAQAMLLLGRLSAVGPKP